MDLDYALRVDAPAALTAESSTEQKASYEKWERSNRISLMIMKGSITNAIRGAIPDSDYAKLYLAHIEEQFQGSSKAHATTLITKMVTLKYSGSNGVREHILRMNDMASQLKGLDMEISEEEERLKSEQPDSAHVAITGPSKGKGKGKKFGKGNVQRNKSASVTKTDKASSSGTKGSSGPRCHFCKDKGHMRKECHKFREWLEKKDLTLMDIRLSLRIKAYLFGSGLLEGNLYKLLLNASFTESLKTMNVNDVVAKTCVFFENAEYSGSCTPRIINLEEIQDHVFIPVIQKVGAPLPHREDNDAPEVVPNDVPLITDPAPIPANEQPLRRNQLEQDEMERIPYASAVGSLMYAQVCTRPDIAKSDNLEVIGYSDSDYAGCVDTLKSTSGYVFMLAEGVVSWKSAKQSLVASHTMEAEFVACFEASCHGVWLKNFITGLKVVDTISRPLKIFYSNDLDHGIKMNEIKSNTYTLFRCQRLHAHQFGIG
ncbi:hypothetical protein RJ640_001834 [Escallonia rubra]|uniref:CCHC-type domain-containing protein n=1 Tax=Escallonia rubra TaxID=112253 RepID=A0AA88UPF2_9ASTE|nr:hypothetical protein RJ640_001834 [Escallonia rubra]